MSGRRPLAGSPPDAYFNYGSQGQLLVCVPSLEIVWVRTGRQIPLRMYAEGSTISHLSALICASATDSGSDD